MPSDDLATRVSALEDAMTAAQAQILLRVRTDDITTIESLRDASQLDTADSVSDLNTRISRMEQVVAVMNKVLNTYAYLAGTNGQLSKDVVYAPGYGPVIQDSSNIKHRIGVNTSGVLSSSVVS